MRRVAAAAGCALGLTAAPCVAQPCCAGATALTPARLALHEDALAGLGTRATDVVGSFDDHRVYRGAQAGDVEADLEQDVLGAVRFFKRAQASVLVPLDQTYRQVGAQREWGGGVGDVVLGLRYDFLEAGQSRRVPGFALLAAATLPTGRPTEDSSTPLATSATGTGAFALAGGASVEQTFGPFLLDLTCSVAWRAPRDVASLHEQLGPEIVASTAVAYTAPEGVVMGLALVYDAEFAATLDGETVADGGRSHTRVAATGGYAFSDRWRAQGAFFWDLPIRGLGQNDPVGMGASFVLVRSWTFS